MKYFKPQFAIALLLMFFIAGFSYAQTKNVQERYSKVKIYAVNSADFNRISNAGLNFDGGIHKPGLYFETWLSESEIKMLNNSGVPYSIEIYDWMEYYNSIPQMSPAQIQEALRKSQQDYDITHSIYGTMGGHLKWAEAIGKIDTLAIEYPTLVSAKWSIGNSYESRPMWTVRITKNPSAPTGRPEIWLNGVTHAREPLGMSNVLYFVYWLVENYNIDPIATYILNNREILDTFY